MFTVAAFLFLDVMRLYNAHTHIMDHSCLLHLAELCTPYVCVCILSLIHIVSMKQRGVTIRIITAIKQIIKPFVFFFKESRVKTKYLSQVDLWTHIFEIKTQDSAWCQFIIYTSIWDAKK